MMNNEDTAADQPIHICPTCGKGGFNRAGYFMHWTVAHKADSPNQKRPPYRLDAWPRAEKGILATGNTAIPT